MKATLLALSLFLIPSIACAEDYSQIPTNVRVKIKAKCVDRYPDDFSMQNGCIMLQSDSYLSVQEYAPAPPVDVTSIPTSVDRAQINNAAYLTVARDTCKIDVGTMVDQYRSNALKSDRKITEEVDGWIAAGVADQKRKAKHDRKAFCAEASKNLPNFVSDLKS